MQVPVGLQQLRRVHQNRAIKSNVKFLLSIHIPYWSVLIYRNYVRGRSESNSEWRVTQLTGDNTGHSSSDSFIALPTATSNWKEKGFPIFTLLFHQTQVTSGVWSTDVSSVCVQMWLLNNRIDSSRRCDLPPFAATIKVTLVLSNVFQNCAIWFELKQKWVATQFFFYLRETGQWPDRVWRHPAADSDSCKCTDTNSETIKTFSSSQHMHIWLWYMWANVKIYSCTTC